MCVPRWHPSGGSINITRVHTLYFIDAPEGCQRGTHTNETAYPLGTYASVHTQTHSSARHSTMRAHAVAGASPPPPASCISVAISHADAMCSATERRCAPDHAEKQVRKSKFRPGRQHRPDVLVGLVLPVIPGLSKLFECMLPSLHVGHTALVDLAIGASGFGVALDGVA